MAVAVAVAVGASSFAVAVAIGEGVADARSVGIKVGLEDAEASSCVTKGVTEGECAIGDGVLVLAESVEPS
jgi:hypothetical protein